MASKLFHVPRYLGSERSTASSSRDEDALEHLHRLARKRASDRRSKDASGDSTERKSGQCHANKLATAECKVVRANGKSSGQPSEGELPSVVLKDSTGGVDTSTCTEDGREVGEEGSGEEREEVSGGVGEVSADEAFAVLGRDTAQLKGRGRVGVSAVPKWMEHPVLVSEDFAAQSMPLEQFPLPDCIVQNLHKMGVTTLFPVQCAVAPHILESSTGLLLRPTSGVRPRDVCVSSPTGSGKTLAYVIPITTVLARFSDHALRCVVVVPSQDLVDQVGVVFDQIGAGTGLKVSKVSGKWSLEKNREQFVDSSHCGRGCVDVLVTTPGCLVDLLSLRLTLSFLRYLVVDEVDRLIDQSFQEWLDRVLAAVGVGPAVVGVGPAVVRVGEQNTLLREMLQPLERSSLYFSPAVLQSNGTPSSVGHPTGPGGVVQDTADSLLGSDVPLQKLLFSATLTQNPEKLALLRLYRPLLFSSLGVSSDLAPPSGAWHSLPASLQEFAVVSSSQDKPLMVLHLLVNLKLHGVLCFARSLESVHRLSRLIQHFGGVACGEFSSARTPGQRQECLRAFEAGRLDILVCSDALARGMDLGKVSVV